MKNEKDRIRRTLINGIYDRVDDASGAPGANEAIVTVVNPNSYNNNDFENSNSVTAVLSIEANSYSQQSISHEFTLNREQRAAFMIITSHLDGDTQCRTGTRKTHLTRV